MSAITEGVRVVEVLESSPQDDLQSVTRFVPHQLRGNIRTLDRGAPVILPVSRQLFSNPSLPFLTEEFLEIKRETFTVDELL